MERLSFFADVLRTEGAKVDLPGGSFYLWAGVPDGDAWEFANDLALQAGVLVSPGDLYGPGGAGYVRVAMVQPMDRLRLAAARLAAG